MKFLDLFAGIGGFRLGMESAGHECVGFCEIDKFARASYQAIHDTKGELELHDITTVSDEFIRGIGRVDIICGGFPCQAFSIAGNRRGFEDTRGTLFFEIARFASILRPRYLFLENVKGLLNHENGITFETIISTFDELGYNVEWQVLNSKDFGVPQNRERVFIIGHLRGQRTRNVFPIGRNTKQVDELPRENITTNTLTARYTAVGNGSYIIESEQKKIKIKEATSQGYAEATVGDSVNLSHPNSKTRRGRVGKQIANTLLTGESQGVVEPDFRIRKLTPKECWRLQGFPDWAFDKAQEVNSNSQLYKQAGNSVTVNVIAAIAKELK
ncbi:DNA cytosine methyltransferase [Streptococcus oralis]|uniref:DNA cytosine methyltransferase n=1 Tax=Streptococcus oralis TaxID=1303 RepID=UPI001D066A19|nr:DNA cytosine methyltransferase [Streptococcus oralis]MCB7107557.1 DNA cytosine methyltransferase [Streptococcus oralis]MCQ5169832.1 DNA cytosine methyltransferase [Streptococcus oralis]